MVHRRNSRDHANLANLANLANTRIDNTAGVRQIQWVAFVWNSARAQVLCGQGYRAEIWNPSPGVLITRLRGFGSVESCRFYTDRAELEMHTGPLLIFHDWQEVQRYAPEARNNLKRWAQRHNEAFEVCHYLMRSKILTMVISVASLALRRDLIVTSERAKFEAALQRCLAARQR